MPFIEKSQRERIEKIGFGEIEKVGDLCFVIYTEMMRRWNKSPCWTTIHFLKKEFVRDPAGSEFLKKVESDLIITSKLENCTCDEKKRFDLLDLYTAAELAFDVFFYRHAIPYEDKKCAKNGDIS